MIFERGEVSPEYTDIHQKQTSNQAEEAPEIIQNIKDDFKKIKQETINLYEIVLEENFSDTPENKENVKLQLIVIMEMMNDFAKSYDPLVLENEGVYILLYEIFQKLVGVKKEMGIEMSKVFSDVFHEYSDLIDDEILNVYIQDIKGIFSVEHVTRELYGRTPEEIEDIKQKNRATVAQVIMEMSGQPSVSLEMVSELHRINNRGIVPKRTSQFRGEGQHISFGKRVGILPEDLEAEVSVVIDKTNTLFDMYALGKISGLMYEIAAAKLHNDLLEIHPFPDRNGSTSLLFLELVMAHRDYVPNIHRERNYYKHLSGVFGNNPVAMGIVGYEHFKIRYQSGHHQGTTASADKSPLYEKMIQKAEERKRHARNGYDKPQKKAA